MRHGCRRMPFCWSAVGAWTRDTRRARCTQAALSLRLLVTRAGVCSACMARQLCLYTVLAMCAGSLLCCEQWCPTHTFYTVRTVWTNAVMVKISLWTHQTHTLRSHPADPGETRPYCRARPLGSLLLRYQVAACLQLSEQQSLQAQDQSSARSTAQTCSPADKWGTLITWTHAGSIQVHVS